ncbi:chorismate binding enzyme, partial [Helicosporidium sp. ATCC 50920]
LRDSAALEFDFCGGLVGYLGYELRHELGSRVRHPATTPDAALFLADQVVVADRRTGVVSALALYGPGEGHEAEARAWTDAQVERLAGLEASAALEGRSQSRGLQTRPPRPASTWSLASQDEEEAGEPAERRDTAEGRDFGSASGGQAHARSTPPSNPRPFTLRHDRAAYVGNVQRCMEHLYSGDSYELCLTTQLRRPAAFSPWSLYRALRRSNAAPFAAFLDFGGAADLQVCCSSPERFLRGSRAGELEAKPIKGTAPRGRNSLEDALAAEALRTSEKDRAENLMIVDLMRNDLGRVCEPGSVHVPSLMAIESYATVHQMVSTVRGQRLKTASVADCVAAAFPGGSMTGAPKLRSMEILERLEGGPRGIYAGSVGFFSANDAFDLNIVIRTAVVHQGHVAVGAGGAIVVQSDPEGEFEEMMLKAGTLAKAFQAIDQEGAEQSA